MSLQLRQSQSLVMTQQLQQSIKLLQLSSVELQEFIDQEVEKNPLLQRDDGEVVETATADNAANDAIAEEALDANYGDGWQHENADITHAQRYHGVDSSPGAARHFQEDGHNLEQYVASEKSLREFLHEQMMMDISDAAMRLIASRLIDMLDEGGYLRESTDQLCQALGAKPELVERTLRALQKLEPTGIFARDLGECLRLQLEERGQMNPEMDRFLTYLPMLEQGRWAELQAMCGVDGTQFQAMLAMIRTLDPFPARQFKKEMTHTMIPDVLVRAEGDAAFRVELNAEALPHVLINREYHAQLTGQTRMKEERKYVSDQLSHANWLVKAMDQRAQTILKVATEIVNQQQDFFRYGIEFLKPLTLKDIALAVGMHESTISRVTTQKFMATPRGHFELKFFFTSSINSARGSDDVSSKTVMFYIRELIEQEDADAVLSDDTIVDMLKRRNVDIARRTVAKYREAMRIPSSVMRRRQKKAFALAG